MVVMVTRVGTYCGVGAIVMMTVVTSIIVVNSVRTSCSVMTNPGDRDR